MRLMIYIMACLTATSAFAQNNVPLNQFFTKADQFLQQHVHDGLVDYAAIKKNPADLNELVNRLGSVKISKEDAATQKAFYINAYNLSMIASLVEKYPIQSPLDDKDIFTGEKHNIAGEGLTLEQIEKSKLLTGGDERLHFVLVCGALGCPPLANFAYTHADVESQILAQTQVALNNPQFIRVNDKEQTVGVSEIFNWYAKDFAATGKNTLAYINQYRSQPIPADYKVTNYTYNWKINEKK